MNNSIKFVLNGQRYFTNKFINLKDIVTYFDYNPSLLVIEHNGYVCPKDNWKDVPISNKDKIEIVTIVGGG